MGRHYSIVNGLRIYRPAIKIPRRRALALSSAVDQVIAERKKEPRLLVKHAGKRLPYKIAQAPRYDYRKHQLTAKVKTNGGARLVRGNRLDDDGKMLWEFAQPKPRDYHNYLPWRWSV